MFGLSRSNIFSPKGCWFTTTGLLQIMLTRICSSYARPRHPAREFNIFNSCWFFYRLFLELAETALVTTFKLSQSAIRANEPSHDFNLPTSGRCVPLLVNDGFCHLLNNFKFCMFGGTRALPGMSLKLEMCESNLFFGF